MIQVNKVITIKTHIHIDRYPYWQDEKMIRDLGGFRVICISIVVVTSISYPSLPHQFTIHKKKSDLLKFRLVNSNQVEIPVTTIDGAGSCYSASQHAFLSAGVEHCKAL